MIPIQLSKPAQSRAHLLALRALNLDAEPKTPEEATKSALAEIFAMHLNREHSPAEIFALAARILCHRDDTHPSNAIIFDVESLCNASGSTREVGVLAVRLCGARMINDRWADDESARLTLTFEAMP